AAGGGGGAGLAAGGGADGRDERPGDVLAPGAADGVAGDGGAGDLHVRGVVELVFLAADRGGLGPVEDAAAAIVELASGRYVQSWPVRMAAATIMTAPLIVVFLLFQRAFVRGVA